MSIILSKIKNGLYTGEDMWMSILMSAAIVLALAWCLSVAWQRNHYLRERLLGLTKHKKIIEGACHIGLDLAVVWVIVTTYLAYMTLVDGIAMIVCYIALKLFLGRVFCGEWSLAPAKTSTVIYAVVAAGLILYIKFAGPFFSSPSLVVFALILSDAIGQVYSLVKGK